MENRSIDIIIKQSLEDFEVNVTPKDWAFMEELLEAEEVTDLDEVAKAKLQSMEVPFDVGSWLTMEAALDDLDVDSIDVTVKEALKNFKMPYNPSDWAIMEAALESDVLNDIDELAKTALENYTVPFSLMDWEMMDEYLDEAGFPHEVDQAAKAALKQYESAMPSNWKAMETALIESEKVHRQLIITKSIELFLFVFAIWTLGNFLPFKQKTSNTIIFPIENSINKNINKNINKTTKPQAEVNVLPSVQQISSIGNEENSNEALQNTSILRNTPAKQQAVRRHLFENTIENVVKNSIKNAIENTNEGNPPSDSNKNTEVAPSGIQPMATLITKPLEEQLVTFPNKKGSPFKTNTEEMNLENSWTYLDTKTLTLDAELENLPTTSVTNDYHYYPLRFKLGVSPQYAIVTNNNSYLNNRKIATGFATNVGIDYAISKDIEISSGIIYNKKSYTQQQQQLFSNSYNQYTLNSIQNVKLDIIQVPIRLNYNMKKNDKTRLYAITGVTAGLIMKVMKETKAASLANGILNFHTTNDDLTTEALATPGILQSGEISTSSFITVDIGLGLEHQVNNRLSFFIEPMYQNSAEKIGTTKDAYQNYSLSMGSRIIL